MKKKFVNRERFNKSISDILSTTDKEIEIADNHELIDLIGENSTYSIVGGVGGSGKSEVFSHYEDGINGRGGIAAVKVDIKNGNDQPAWFTDDGCFNGKKFRSVLISKLKKHAICFPDYEWISKTSPAASNIKEISKSKLFEGLLTLSIFSGLFKKYPLPPILLVTLISLIWLVFPQEYDSSITPIIVFSITLSFSYLVLCLIYNMRLKVKYSLEQGFQGFPETSEKILEDVFATELKEGILRTGNNLLYLFVDIDYLPTNLKEESLRSNIFGSLRSKGLNGAHIHTFIISKNARVPGILRWKRSKSIPRVMNFSRNESLEYLQKSLSNENIKSCDIGAEILGFINQEKSSNGVIEKVVFSILGGSEDTYATHDVVRRIDRFTEELAKYKYKELHENLIDWVDGSEYRSLPQLIEAYLSPRSLFDISRYFNDCSGEANVNAEEEYLCFISIFNNKIPSSLLKSFYESSETRTKKQLLDFNSTLHRYSIYKKVVGGTFYDVNEIDDEIYKTLKNRDAVYNKSFQLSKEFYCYLTASGIRSENIETIGTAIDCLFALFRGSGFVGDGFVQEGCELFDCWRYGGSACISETSNLFNLSRKNINYLDEVHCHKLAEIILSSSLVIDDSDLGERNILKGDKGLIEYAIKYLGAYFNKYNNKKLISNDVLASVMGLISFVSPRVMKLSYEKNFIEMMNVINNSEVLNNDNESKGEITSKRCENLDELEFEMSNYRVDKTSLQQVIYELSILYENRKETGQRYYQETAALYFTLMDLVKNEPLSFGDAVLIRKISNSLYSNFMNIGQGTQDEGAEIFIHPCRLLLEAALKSCEENDENKLLFEIFRHSDYSIKNKYKLDDPAVSQKLDGFIKSGKFIELKNELEEKDELYHRTKYLYFVSNNIVVEGKLNISLINNASLKYPQQVSEAFGAWIRGQDDQESIMVGTLLLHRINAYKLVIAESTKVGRESSRRDYLKSLLMVIKSYKCYRSLPGISNLSMWEKQSEAFCKGGHFSAHDLLKLLSTLNMRKNYVYLPGDFVVIRISGVSDCGMPEFELPNCTSTEVQLDRKFWPASISTSFSHLLYEEDDNVLDEDDNVLDYDIEELRKNNTGKYILAKVLRDGTKGNRINLTSRGPEFLSTMFQFVFPYAQTWDDANCKNEPVGSQDDFSSNGMKSFIWSGDFFVGASNSAIALRTQPSLKSLILYKGYWTGFITGFLGIRRLCVFNRLVATEKGNDNYYLEDTEIRHFVNDFYSTLRIVDISESDRSVKISLGEDRWNPSTNKIRTFVSMFRKVYGRDPEIIDWDTRNNLLRDKLRYLNREWRGNNQAILGNMDFATILILRPNSLQRLKELLFPENLNVEKVLTDAQYLQILEAIVSVRSV